MFNTCHRLLNQFHTNQPQHKTLMLSQAAQMASLSLPWKGELRSREDVEILRRQTSLVKNMKTMLNAEWKEREGCIWKSVMQSSKLLFLCCSQGWKPSQWVEITMWEVWVWTIMLCGSSDVWPLPEYSWWRRRTHLPTSSSVFNEWL